MDAGVDIHVRRRGKYYGSTLARDLPLVPRGAYWTSKKTWGAIAAEDWWKPRKEMKEC
jgi:hypothetical protein